MKKLIYILTILFSCFSCTKGGGNVYIEGRFYNPITGEGIAGAEIALCRDKLGGMLGAQSSGVKAVETVHTDENGYYHIKHAGISSYFIRLMSLGDYAGIGWVNIHSKNKTYSANGADVKIHLGKTMHADFRAVPYGYLKLSIHNVNCMGGDSMRFRFQTIGESDFESWSNYRTGCYMYDDPGGGAKVPMGWRYYQWEVTRNGSVNYYTDSVFVPDNNSTTFTINY